MANKITNTEYYAAIANAIRAKNGEIDTYTPAEMADAIGRIPKGGGAKENDVNFYDYDGSIVASYTAAQFAALEEMPENPDHTDEGLTSQGWNWNFADAQDYVSKYRALNVGQIYIPTDGKTHVYINIPKDDPSYETTLYFGHIEESGQTVVDWGDGTPAETVSGSSDLQHSHIYLRPGEYEITLDTDGTMKVSGSGASRNAVHFSGAGSYARNLTRIEKICFSANVSILDNALGYSYALKSVTIPYGIASIGERVFANCINIQSIMIPNSITSIASYAFAYCYSLKLVGIPNSVISLGTNTFANDYALRIIFIPNSLTTIPASTFSNCYGITMITIPTEVASIGANAFNNCYSISRYYFLRTPPPGLSNTNAFGNISADTVIYVNPNAVNSYKFATNWKTYADRIVAIS